MHLTKAICFIPYEQLRASS